MRKLHILLGIIAYYTFLTSCSSDIKVYEIDEIDENKAKVDFGFIKEKTFPIDDSSDYLMALPQSFEKDGKIYLSRLDMAADEIEIFDYASAQLVHSVKFDKDGGPNSISGSINAYQIVREDSIFLMDDSKRLILANLSGEILSTYNIPTDRVSPWIKPSTVPMSLKGNVATLINYPIVNLNRPILLDIDLTNSVVSTRYEVPNEFIEGYWAIGDFKWFSLVDHGDSKIFSFPNLDSLYIYNNSDTSLSKKYAGSKAFETIESDLVEFGVRPSEEMLPILHFTRPVYSRLIYDPYKDLYYRIIGKPIKESLLFSDDVVKGRTREYYILVLDKDFKWLGEFDLPPYKYRINGDMNFFNKEGLHLQRDSEDENEAVFDIYNIIQK